MELWELLPDYRRATQMSLYEKPQMTSAGYNLYLQQGTGNYTDSEESDLSQQSEVILKIIKKRILLKKSELS